MGIGLETSPHLQHGALGATRHGPPQGTLILDLALVAQVSLILSGYCLLHHSCCQQGSWSGSQPGKLLGLCTPGPGSARGVKHFQTFPQNYKISFYYSCSSVKTLHETKEKFSSSLANIFLGFGSLSYLMEKNHLFYFSRALIFVWRHLTHPSGCRSPNYADPGTLRFMLVP